MTLKDVFLEALEREAARTRRVVEEVPTRATLAKARESFAKVHLRLLELKVPSVFGPSADDQRFL